MKPPHSSMVSLSHPAVCIQRWTEAMRAASPFSRGTLTPCSTCGDRLELVYVAPLFVKLVWRSPFPPSNDFPDKDKCKRCAIILCIECVARVYIVISMSHDSWLGSYLIHSGALDGARPAQPCRGRPWQLCSGSTPEERIKRTPAPCLAWPRIVKSR